MKMPSMNTEVVALDSIRTKSSEERLSSRRLSRELPIVVDNSVDVYYRESSVGIPFLWESQPGTPKIRSRESPLPPLTPPPSFHASPISRKPTKKHPKNNLVPTVLLPRLNLMKNQFHQSPSRSTSSSSSPPWSSSSSPFGTPNESKQSRILSPARLSFDSRFGSRIEEDECESPVSTLCFRAGRSTHGRSRGCSSSIIKLLLGEF
ncbi:hypothetical protein Pfo_006925 [Paulownia fortunei]|nr:hypothetical protein Pfo_006925 [Paulownia fortunei]